jgi:hypothetical protein
MGSAPKPRREAPLILAVSAVLRHAGPVGVVTPGVVQRPAAGPPVGGKLCAQVRASLIVGVGVFAHAGGALAAPAPQAAALQVSCRKNRGILPG